MTRAAEMAQFLREYKHPENHEKGTPKVAIDFGRRWPDATREEWDQAMTTAKTIIAQDVAEGTAEIADLDAAFEAHPHRTGATTADIQGEWLSKATHLEPGKIRAAFFKEFPGASEADYSAAIKVGAAKARADGLAQLNTADALEELHDELAELDASSSPQVNSLRDKFIQFSSVAYLGLTPGSAEYVATIAGYAQCKAVFQLERRVLDWCAENIGYEADLNDSRDLQECLEMLHGLKLKAFPPEKVGDESRR